MDYKFNYQMRAYDLWQLSLERIYHSMIGVCNLVFTVAMVFVTIKFWKSRFIIRGILVFACLLFTVIQPIVIYGRSRQQVKAFPRGVEICFDEKGMHIDSNGQCSDLRWHQIKHISKRKSMLVLYTTMNQGVLLSNEVLGLKREAFYEYVTSKIKAS